MYCLVLAETVGQDAAVQMLGLGFCLLAAVMTSLFLFMWLMLGLSSCYWVYFIFLFFFVITKLGLELSQSQFKGMKLLISLSGRQLKNCQAFFFFFFL